MTSCSIMQLALLLCMSVTQARVPFIADIIHRGGSLSSAEDLVLQDVALNQQEASLSLTTINVDEACRDFGDTGQEAFRFLRGLAASPIFFSDYWQKKPLLLRANDERARWVADAFTLDQLKLIDQSYITGFKTADILRNGTKTDSWEFVPIKADLTKPTTWRQVEEALEGGTIYFNNAGSLWPNIGAICRITMAAFGFPTNVNVYVTPAGTTLSVPPHTDKQDVLVFQTQGAKRWRIYAPPRRTTAVDPLSRGKAGDVMTQEELGEPLIDAMIRKGDILYVPPGFPHTTDTLVDGDDEQDTSVHLTMGLDTHCWGLTMAYARWSVLNRCKMEYKLEMKNDTHYWESSRSLPVGFAGRACWIESLEGARQNQSLVKSYRGEIITKVKALMVLLEPQRWKTSDSSGTEEFPSDDEFEQVIDYMICTHLRTLLTVQDEMFSNVESQDENSIVKAFEGTKKQNLAMEEFGSFSNSTALRDSFAQRRLQQEAALRAL